MITAHVSFRNILKARIPWMANILYAYSLKHTLDEELYEHECDTIFYSAILPSQI